MAATPTVLKSEINENKTSSVLTGTFTVALDSSYPTGGYSLTAAGLGFTTLDYVRAYESASNTRRYVYDHGNSKLMAFVSATEAEVANGVDLSAVTALRLLAIGRR